MASTWDCELWGDLVWKNPWKTPNPVVYHYFPIKIDIIFSPYDILWLQNSIPNILQKGISVDALRFLTRGSLGPWALKVLIGNFKQPPMSCESMGTPSHPSPDCWVRYVIYQEDPRSTGWDDSCGIYQCHVFHPQAITIFMCEISFHNHPRSW